MIDGEQFLASFAHLSLRGEEVFGSSFVAHFRFGGHVSKPIKGGCPGAGDSAYQATTFRRRSFTGMSDHGLEMFAAELNRRHLKIRISNFESRNLLHHAQV